MIRVLIVDDSGSARRLLARALSEFNDIEVVGTAPDAMVADQMILAQKPDVMTLDVEMPGIDGLTFLERLLRREPVSVVIISSLTTRGSDAALRALELGAVEVLAKPGASEAGEFPNILARSIRAAASAKVMIRSQYPTSRTSLKTPQPGLNRATGTPSKHILAIGASTGGTEAIRVVLKRMNPNTPATVIVQHLPAGFTASFAQRLDATGPMRVTEARGGEEPLIGHAYIAPGGYHLLLQRRAGRFQLEINNAPREQFQRPSVDVLFRSVAKAAGRQAIGVLLTGMGQDGAQGLLEMLQAGSRTFAQDEASSVVFGMPKAAIERGAAERTLNLDQLPSQIATTFAVMGEVSDKIPVR